MKRITMENCETLEGRKFNFYYRDGSIKIVQVAIVDKDIGMTCKVCYASGSMTDDEAVCFDFRNGDKLHGRAAFLIVANSINKGVFKAEKWLSMFVPGYRDKQSKIADCAFQ